MLLNLILEMIFGSAIFKVQLFSFEQIHSMAQDWLDKTEAFLDCLATACSRVVGTDEQTERNLTGIDRQFINWTLLYNSTNRKSTVGPPTNSTNPHCPPPPLNRPIGNPHCPL